ncbi:MAG TPA: flagellar motor protein MotB [Bacillota bacterium]|nr:flagellar motor protein MotB [Bacillota bacterium]
MKRKTPDYNRVTTGTWLTTYADLMNNLLVMFIMLYMMSTIDLQKFKSLSYLMSELLGGRRGTEVVDHVPDPLTYEMPDVEIQPPETQPEQEDELGLEDNTGQGIMYDLDEFVNRIAEIIRKKGYGDQIDVERVNNYVYFRLREGVLFYPDLAVLKDDSYDILSLVADIIKEAYNEIYKIEICGHTAWVAIDEIPTNFNSWELSSKRALTVMKYFVTECELPKYKMVLSAFSSTEPYTKGETEEEKAMNRRVEIRLSRLIDQPSEN